MGCFQTHCHVQVGSTRGGGGGSNNNDDDGVSFQQTVGVEEVKDEKKEDKKAGTQGACVLYPLRLYANHPPSQRLSKYFPVD